MASQPQVSNNQTWSESLNPQLTRRLLRPIVSPGVIGTQVAGSIISRVQGMTNQLPLMAKLIQRQHRLEGQSAEAVPIVYAQPIRPAAEPVETGHVTSPITSTNVASGTKVTGEELPLRSTRFQVEKETSVQKSTGSNSQKSTENPTPQTSSSIPSERGKSGTKPLIVQAKFVNSTKRNSRRVDSDNKPLVSGLESSRETRLSSDLSWPVVQAKPIDFLQKSGTGNREQGTVDKNLDKHYQKTTLQSKRSLGSSGNLTQSPVIQRSPKRSLIKEIVSSPSQGNQPLIQRTPERPVIKEIVNSPSQGNQPLIQPTPERPVIKEIVKSPSEGNQPLIQRSPERPVVREISGKDGYQLSAPLIFSASGVNRTSVSGNGLGVSSGPSMAHNGSGVIQRMPSVNGASVSTPVSTTRLQANTVIQKASENTSAATTNNQSVEDIDVDELVDKVHHKLMQHLTIESERRGLTQWH
ncbi:MULTISPECIES: hypothetical protein [Moorena]|uniref:Uncharacterized protein n=1 Tax=Moorena producens 3L TaxID=489825 RepID=F4XRT6_9CYAN|nr:MULTISPECIES: hypothetical protein [Moorena]NEQ15715.1 hypothetical protein [Moorena sp. SIO3E2]EGJ32655.1 hypothetical protein LYNGBM3L_05140 [Moorena producens 3L]NEP65182.1 hypothetical protein [Moorena sp. SIO3A5]NER87838.1 hypothetical protein [Moorena sp. SIO3A2]NES45398.1 hypothetical protein [Moorena sp. SIO2C4]